MHLNNVCLRFNKFERHPTIHSPNENSVLLEFQECQPFEPVRGIFLSQIKVSEVQPLCTKEDIIVTQIVTLSSDVVWNKNFYSNLVVDERCASNIKSVPRILLSNECAEDILNRGITELKDEFGSDTRFANTKSDSIQEIISFEEIINNGNNFSTVHGTVVEDSLLDNKSFDHQVELCTSISYDGVDAAACVSYETLVNRKIKGEFPYSSQAKLEPNNRLTWKKLVTHASDTWSIVQLRSLDEYENYVKVLVNSDVSTRISVENFFFDNAESQYLHLIMLLDLACKEDCVRNFENYFKSIQQTHNLLTAACAGGYMKTVSRLIEDFNCDVDAYDSFGCTPLTVSCSFGQLEIVKLLINHSLVDLNKPTLEKQTPLILACAQSQIYVSRWLLRIPDYLDVNYADTTLRTALHYVIEHSQEGGRRPLHDACIEGNMETVRNIVYESSLSEINEQDNDGWTPLHIACLMGHLDVVKMLMWAGADCDIFDNDFLTPAELAIKAGYPYIADVIHFKPITEWRPTYFPFFIDLLENVMMWP